MQDEMRSMSTNDVWYLEEIPKGAKTVGYKWVYKTKSDSKRNMESYNARLVVKGFMQREGKIIIRHFLRSPARILLES